MNTRIVDSRLGNLLSKGTRVVLNAKDSHPQNGQLCTVIGALPNPWGREEDQWYDVQFDDHILERFLGKYLTAGVQ